jgi:hypothetical protein
LAKPSGRPGRFVGANSTQQGLLKAQLKGAQSASRGPERALEMLHGLKERVALRTVGRRLLAAKQTTQIRQPSTQPLKQMVYSLQAERQRQGLESRFGRTAAQQPLEQPPQPGGRNTVARQHLGQENTKGSSAAPTLAAIGAKDPLSAQRLSVGYGGIVAVELTVTI